MCWMPNIISLSPIIEAVSVSLFHQDVASKWLVLLLPFPSFSQQPNIAGKELGIFIVSLWLVMIVLFLPKNPRPYFLLLTLVHKSGRTSRMIKNSITFSSLSNFRSQSHAYLNLNSGSWDELNYKKKMQESDLENRPWLWLKHPKNYV